MQTLIPVVGSEDFKNKVEMALAWLNHQSKADITWVQMFINKIEQSTINGMHIERKVLTLTFNYVEHSTTPWLASVIAHDACHAYLYRHYQSLHPNEVVPVDRFYGTAAEKECNKYQLRVLKRVEGSASELHYLSTQDGTHWKNPPK
jgi:hypothetical protein